MRSFGGVPDGQATGKAHQGPLSRYAGEVPATKAQYARFLHAQGVYGANAGVAIGKNGAVSVTYNGIAARAKSHAEKSSARIESNP